MFNKKYKKGMAEAAKIFGAFEEKQSEAIEHVLEEFRQGKRELEDTLRSLTGNVGSLYEYLRSNEKQELYTVYTPFDIQLMGEEERLFLVGAILRLTMDCIPTEDQKTYLRSIQRYLDIKELPFGVDPLAVENIDNTNFQKAIFQAVIEFLRLQEGDSYDQTQLQQDFLDAINLNEKTKREIISRVELLYAATGAIGLTEKYGFIPEEASHDEIEDKSECVDENTVSSEAADGASDNFASDENGIAENSDQNPDAEDQACQKPKGATESIRIRINQLSHKDTSFYQSADQYAQGDLKKILAQMTYAGQEDVDSVIGIYDINPFHALSGNFSGILFLKRGFYFKQKDSSFPEYMDYSEIKRVQENFSTLIIYGSKQTLKLKSISYAQPELAELFRELAILSK